MELNFKKDFSYNNRYTDFYFGMDPEASIRLHFPNDNKWQLLPKIITKDEFKSMAYLDEGFYSLGLKIISPDIQSLNSTKDTTFRITSDKSFDEIFEDFEFQVSIEIKGEMPMFGFISITKISNGLYEFDSGFLGAGFSIYMLKIKKLENNFKWYLLVLIINF